MAYCDKCGKSLKEGAKFCDICGFPTKNRGLREQPADSPQPVAPTRPADSQPPARPAPRPAQKAPASGGPNVMILAVVVIAVLITVAAIAYFLTNAPGKGGAVAPRTPVRIDQPAGGSTGAPDADIESQNQVENAEQQPAGAACPDGMVLIPEGDFIMGSDDQEDEMPRRSVSLGSYCIDKYEITNNEFINNSPGHASFENSSGPNQPATRVLWSEANGYCQSIGARLCSESEWEKTCRGPNGNIWAFGNSYSPSICRLEHGNDGSVDVGSMSQCQSYYGVYDMTGNVAEWTADEYNPYPGGVSNKNMSRGYHVHRGGHWGHNAEKSRCAMRNYNTRDDARNDVTGFRCCSDVVATGGGE